MDIVIEDGTCVVGANSYTDLASAKAFLSAFVDLSKYSDDTITSCLLQGHAYLNLKYSGKLRGSKKCSALNFLDFPRNNLYTVPKYSALGITLETGIPDSVKEAVCWATLLLLSGKSIQEVIQGVQASGVRIEGLLDVDFREKAVKQNTEDYYSLIVGRIDGLLNPFLWTNYGVFLVERGW